MTLQPLSQARPHAVRPLPQIRFSADFIVKVELIRKVYLIDKVVFSQSRWRIIGRGERRVNISWEGRKWAAGGEAGKFSVFSFQCSVRKKSGQTRIAKTDASDFTEN